MNRTLVSVALILAVLVFALLAVRGNADPAIIEWCRNCS
jgi:hypothetical protein